MWRVINCVFFRPRLSRAYSRVTLSRKDLYFCIKTKDVLGLLNACKDGALLECLKRAIKLLIDHITKRLFRNQSGSSCREKRCHRNFRTEQCPCRPGGGRVVCSLFVLVICSAMHIMDISFIGWVLVAIIEPFLSAVGLHCYNGMRD